MLPQFYQFTVLSILLITRLDIHYFIDNYPRRALIIGVLSISILALLWSCTDVFQTISLKKEFRKIKRKTIVSSHEFLEWIYAPNSSEDLLSIEKTTSPFLTKNMQFFIAIALLFNHSLVKFSNPEFLTIFLFIAFLNTILSIHRNIKKYCLKIYTSAIFVPPVLYFIICFASLYVGRKPFFLESQFLVSSLSLDPSDWLYSTIIISVFSSGFLLLLIFIWTVLSWTGEKFLEFCLSALKLFLKKLPVFQQSKEKARKRYRKSKKLKKNLA